MPPLPPPTMARNPPGTVSSIQEVEIETERYPWVQQLVGSPDGWEASPGERRCGCRVQSHLRRDAVRMVFSATVAREWQAARAA